MPGGCFCFGARPAVVGANLAVTWVFAFKSDLYANSGNEHTAGGTIHMHSGLYPSLGQIHTRVCLAQAGHQHPVTEALFL